MSVGMLGHIGIGKETTWGTGVAVTDYIEALSENITTTIERFETKNIIAGLYEPDDSAGIRRHEGDITFAVGPRNVGHILRGAFGVSSVAVVLSGVLFTSQFTPINAYVGSLVPLDSYTIEVYRPGATNTATSFRYVGCQVSKLSFNLKPNQDLRCVASIIAQDRSTIAKTTASFQSSPTQFFTFDVASVSLAGAAVTRFGEVNFEFDNQLEGVPLLDGTTTITRVARTGSQLVRASGSIEFDNFTDFDAFQNATEQRFFVRMFRASSFALLIDLPRMIFTEMPVVIEGKGRITANFSAMGRYEPGSGNAIKLSLTTVTSY